MSNKDDGGSAFPGTEIHFAHGVSQEYSYPGMSLRDYFAAKAMQGIISNTDAVNGLKLDPDRVGQKLKDAISQSAYRYADAMLEARKQSTEEKSSYANDKNK